MHTLREASREDEWIGWLVDPGIRAILEPDQWMSLAEQVDDRPTHLLPWGFQAHRHRCRAHLALLRAGPSLEAAEALEAAIGAYRKWGGLVAMHQTQAELAEVLDDLGQQDEAARLRATVRDFYERLGANAWLAELDRVGAAPPAPG